MAGHFSQMVSPKVSNYSIAMIFVPSHLVLRYLDLNFFCRHLVLFSGPNHSSIGWARATFINVAYEFGTFKNVAITQTKYYLR